MKEGKYDEDNLFEWTMRPELVTALKALNMTDPENTREREKMSYEKRFYQWMQKQDYTENTIKTYCLALKSSVKKLNTDKEINTDLFTYTDPVTFGQIVLVIRSVSNFQEIDKHAGNGAFAAGLIKYEEFLKEMNSHKRSFSESVDLLKANHNLILHGAPGTGKTYLAKEIAKTMGADEDSTGFVQFHPSYDYTDFVEGLRPVQNNGSENIGFERKDGAWLWEEYLATILTKEPYSFIHPRNKRSLGWISPFSDKNIGRFYPDFYRNNDCVLDAKYKMLDIKNPDASDLAQVIAYMHILGCKQGGYVYPSKTNTTSPDERRLLDTLKGFGGTMYTYGVSIPQNATDFTEFVQIMGAKEKVPWFVSTSD